MISSDQIKAARALLRWTANDLALSSGLGVSTVKRIELADGIPTGRVKTLHQLQQALERAGVEFTGSVDNKPGVCLDLEKHAHYVEALDHGQTQND